VLLVTEVIDQQTRLVKLSSVRKACSRKVILTMVVSLARRAVFAASRTRPTALATQSRAASSSHDDHHHQEDTTVYPTESAVHSWVSSFTPAHAEGYTGFLTPFWGKVLLASILTGIGIKYAPEPSEDVYLTRWIALYRTPPEFWRDVSARHTALESEVSDNNLLVADARTPPIHRFRYPQ